MTSACEVIDRESQPTLCVRTRSPASELSDKFGEAYEAIGTYMAEAGSDPAGPPYAAYYNMDMEDLDVEIGIPVADSLPGKGEITTGEIPAGPTATCLHTGPYDDIPEAYDVLSAWVQEKGYVVAGAP